MIEDDRIVSVIARECEIMTETVKSMPIKGSAAEQADVVTDQNKAITNMLTAIRKIDGDVLRADPPTNTWLADWEALIAAREAFAEQRRDGYDADLRRFRATLMASTTYLRMDQVWVSKSVCDGARRAAQSLCRGRLRDLSCGGGLLLGDLLERPHLGERVGVDDIGHRAIALLAIVADDRGPARRLHVELLGQQRGEDLGLLLTEAGQRAYALEERLAGTWLGPDAGCVTVVLLDHVPASSCRRPAIDRP